MTDTHRDDNHNWGQRLQIVLVLAVLAAFGLAGYAVDRGVDDKEAAEIFAKYYEDTAEAKNELCDDKANAKKPECVKDAPPPEAIDEGTPIPVGPSAAEVDASVRELLPILLADQVGRYFEANPVEDGSDGDRGPRGPGPTFDTVLEAVAQLLPGIVADYFEANPVEDGTDGADAPTVTEITCTSTIPSADTFTFVYTFSDDSTITETCSLETP